ncbi:hypothetical protein [Bacillus sp. EB600]|uniref:hypothetical protein n=1 Tax=Bacillus sp. EB600 TaxID=2806345 RepID=UPI00210A5DD6|nr:hypothetical protein [Bacillus sp. EB600]MCQ6282874.1 hypothetical protein [Bacillus sp. EB600]
MVYSGSSESSTEVQTSAANLSSFERKISKNEAEFMNEFDLTISFNGVSNTDHVFVRTKFLYVKGEGWKSDSIEYIGEITRKAGETSK